MQAVALSLPQPVAPNPVVVRLADEGVPVRAIARAVSIASSDVYEMLRDALAAGMIVELPKDDWPPGSRRDARAAFNGSPLETDEALQLACCRYFRATRLEAAILATLLKRSEVTKGQLHLVIEQNRPSDNREETDPKMVDVVICHLRKKLKPFGLVIKTIWGVGYLITASDRERAAAILKEAADG